MANIECPWCGARYHTYLDYHQPSYEEEDGDDEIRGYLLTCPRCGNDFRYVATYRLVDEYIYRSEPPTESKCSKRFGKRRGKCAR